jgi:chitinase
LLSTSRLVTDPGSPLRATVSLSATATDSGSGVSGGVVFQHSPAGAATWTTICTDASAPYTCSFDTTTVPDGVYDLRAYADDAVGERGTSTVASRSIDNTAPTATDIQTVEGGGTAGKLEQTDAIVFTFSENLDPATIVAGWNGTGSVTVDVAFGDAGANDTFTITNPNAGGAAVLVNGAVTLGNNYVTRTITCAASTLTRNTTNRTVTVTLSAPSPGNANFRPGGPGNGTMTWPVLSTLKDLAGNSMATASVTESGVADREF